MYVQKETINEYFKRFGNVNGKTSGIGHGRFIKKIKDSVYAAEWWFFNNIFFVASEKIKVWQYLWFCYFTCWVLVFFIFCSLRKNLRMSTYGSVGLWVESLNDLFGKKV